MTSGSRTNRLAPALRAGCAGLGALIGWLTLPAEWGAIVGLISGLVTPDVAFMALIPWRSFKPLYPLCANARCSGPTGYAPVAFNNAELKVCQRPGISRDGYFLRCNCGLEHFDPGKRLFSRWEWFVVTAQQELRLVASAAPFRGWRRLPQ